MGPSFLGRCRLTAAWRSADMAASRLAGADRLPELRPDYLNTGRTRLNPVRGQHVSGLLVSLSLTEVMHLGRLLAIDPCPCRGDRDFDAVDLVLAPLSSEHFDQREAGQVDQRIEKLSGLVPGHDVGRLWS